MEVNASEVARASNVASQLEAATQSLNEKTDRANKAEGLADVGLAFCYSL